MTMRQAAGGAGDVEEPERSPDEELIEDPAGRPGYVAGPTGSAPISSELRGDPGSEGDRRAEGGAIGGAIVGTAVAGPIGGAVGAVAGGTAGTAAEASDDADDDDDLEPRDRNA